MRVTYLLQILILPENISPNLQHPPHQFQIILPRLHLRLLVPNTSHTLLADLSDSSVQPNTELVIQLIIGDQNFSDRCEPADERGLGGGIWLVGGRKGRFDRFAGDLDNRISQISSHSVIVSQSPASESSHQKLTCTLLRQPPHRLPDQPPLPHRLDPHLPHHRPIHPDRLPCLYEHSIIPDPGKILHCKGLGLFRGSAVQADRAEHEAVDQGGEEVICRRGAGGRVGGKQAGVRCSPEGGEEFAVAFKVDG